MIRWLATGVLALLLAVPAWSASNPPIPRNVGPRLLLSWGAPYGQPGARENVDLSCDSTLVDTLYLCVDPGRDAAHFLGVTATLYLHAPTGTPLPAFWQIQHMNAPGSPLRIDFDPDTARGFEVPWNSRGVGQAEYDYVTGSGRIRMIYAVASTSYNPVTAGKVYGFARLLVHHPASGVSGCGTPMCVEWNVALLAFDPGDEPAVNRGVRWVSLNSPGGAVCQPMRDILRPPSWHPK